MLSQRLMYLTTVYRQVLPDIGYSDGLGLWYYGVTGTDDFYTPADGSVWTNRSIDKILLPKTIQHFPRAVHNGSCIQ